VTQPLFEPAKGNLRKCQHCGRMCGDYEGGFASINSFPVCHPNVDTRPDCYTLVTLHHHHLPCLECGQPELFEEVTT